MLRTWELRLIPGRTSLLSIQRYATEGPAYGVPASWGALLHQSSRSRSGRRIYRDGSGALYERGQDPAPLLLRGAEISALDLYSCSIEIEHLEQSH
jgi:hypothetical protein